MRLKSARFYVFFLSADYRLPSTVNRLFLVFSIHSVFTVGVIKNGGSEGVG